MTSRFAVALAVTLFLCALLVRLAGAALVFAQTPTGKAEPTKPPYVFPTPIFIPTYAGLATATVAKTTPVLSPALAATRAPAAGSAEQRTYTVISGDNPWTIAQKVYGNGARYPVILAANGLTESSRLRVGQVLKIPATDAGGQAPPTPAPTALAPTDVPTATPEAIPATPAPVPSATPTPVPSSGWSTAAPEVAMVFINIVSTILFLGAIASGVLAFLVYRRSVRLHMVKNLPRRLRLRS